jgi:hypothetical protein
MCVMGWSAIRTSGLSSGERGTGCVGLQVCRLSLWWGRVASMRINVGQCFKYGVGLYCVSIV